MSPLLRKELRLLWPAWVAALAAAILPLFFGPEFSGILTGAFAVAMLALVLAPFGQENNHGTLALLLVQPADRRHFWNVKTILTGLAVATAWALYALVLWPQTPKTKDFWELFKVSGLMAALAFSGGLWTTLVLRDIIPSLFCTVLVPAILAGVFAVSSQLCFLSGSEEGEVLTIFVLECYAVISFAWGRRLFIDAQDTVWTGGQMSLSSVKGISLRWLAFRFNGRQNPWLALIKKELQLQEVTMILVPVFALLHFLLLGAHHFYPQWFNHQEWLVAAVLPVWFVSVPCVIGCAAVAEERRFNTLESQLCLPVRKRSQFMVKLIVVLVLGTVLGGWIPWILGGWLDVKAYEISLTWTLAIAAEIAGAAFYASTMTKGLLQALPAAVGLPMYVALVFKIALNFRDPNTFPVTQSSWFLAIMVPSITIAAMGLAYMNYQRLRIGYSSWLRNLARLGTITGAATLLTMGIFDRAWELFLTLEPQHGPPQITGPGHTSMCMDWRSVYLLLPDGRIWIGQTVLGPGKAVLPRGMKGHFIEGTTWTKIGANETGAIALQTDGSLWNLMTRRRIGQDTDWQDIAAAGETFLAVKRTGTLWGWGNAVIGLISSQSPPKIITTPIQIGKENNWANVFLNDSQWAFGGKRDGTVWEWGNTTINGYQWDLRPISQKLRVPMPEGQWESFDAIGSVVVGIRADGNFWTAFSAGIKTFDTLRSKSDWAALAGRWHLAMLERNGTLWAATLHQIRHPSVYKDWIAVGEYGGLTWALAKDGTLSCWELFDFNRPQDKSKFSERFFLGPTRRPLFSANIFNL